MMKNRLRIVACCLAVTVLLALTGCQLAQEDKGESATEDRLIGVLVTTEYLDLFDMERYLNDNLKGNPDGEITIDGNVQEYQGRLYATLEKETLTDEVTGQTTEIEQFVFKGIKGIPYYAARVPATAERESFLTTGSDEAISDGHTSINQGDKESSVSLEGTIYASPNGNQHVYYFNPVYQSADGRVYVTTGNGMSSSGDQAEGVVSTHTMNATYTATENGKSASYTTSIKLSIHLVNTPKMIVVLQMDGASAVVSRNEYAPGTLPKAIAPEPGAEYIVVETHKTDREGKAQVTRTLYGIDAEALDTFRRREDGICVKQWTQLNWPEQQATQ